MKGYTEVTVDKALLALKNRNKRKDIALALEERAIKDFATKWRKDAHWYSRRKSSGLSDCDLFFKQVTYWSRRITLEEFLTEDEYKLYADFDRNCFLEKQQGSPIRQLVNASTSGILLLDNELCEFINKFTTANEDES